VMGSSPMQSGTPSSTSLAPQSPIPAPTHNSGDAVPVLPRVHHSGDHEADLRKTWMPKMDFHVLMVRMSVFGSTNALHIFSSMPYHLIFV
jgi:hypothetical protein